MKRKFAIKFLSLVTLLLSSCSVLDFVIGAKVESISITNPIEQMFVGRDHVLEASISPSNAKNKQVIWKSSNEEIASIDEDGRIKGISEGNTQIEVHSKENYDISDKFNLKVVEPRLINIHLTSYRKYQYDVGETYDPSGLVIEASYDNNFNEQIDYDTHRSEFSFVPDLTTPLTLENDKVTITYKGLSTTLRLVVSEPPEIEKTHLQYTYDEYMKNNLYPNMDNCPLEGNPKILIIPIWFNDSDNFISLEKKSSVREDIRKAYLGSQIDTGWQSVKTYYETESFGKISLSGTVSDWYEVDDSYVSYARGSASIKTAELVNTASTYYFDNHSSDRKGNYDSNNDGYLDGVILIYAAPDYDSLGIANYSNLWAYCSWTQAESKKFNPAANVFFWASYDFLYGSNAYEKTGKSSYARGYTEHIEIDTHCLIHEMGHVFGLEDYYDYSEQYNPAGGFSMQDYNVGGHDPYSVMAYGWLDPYIPDKAMTISIGDFQSTHDVILLANHTVDKSPFDEYLLLEFYTPTGLNELDSTYTYRYTYPTGSNEPGIRLWHVDARLISGIASPSSITVYPTSEVYHAMSNTYDGGYASILGSSYYNYNVLQLIRNDESITYRPTDNLTSSSLFKEGDSFDMSTYSSQFVNGTKMNDGNKLGWSFKVDSISDSKATITLTMTK